MIGGWSRRARPSGRRLHHQRPRKRKRKRKRRAQCRPLTPAIMRPATMECVIGRGGVERVAGWLGVRVCPPAAERLVAAAAAAAAAVSGHFLQRQRDPLTFVTWRRSHNRHTRVGFLVEGGVSQEENPTPKTPPPSTGKCTGPQRR